MQIVSHLLGVYILYCTTIGTLFLYSRFILASLTCIPNVYKSVISIYTSKKYLQPSPHLYTWT